MLMKPASMKPMPRFDPAELRSLPAPVLEKYDVAGPRYTSYPTAPAWVDTYGPADYRAALARSAASKRPLSLYVHLPFCESLCVYCGCNVIITKRRDRAQAYLDVLFKEIDLVADLCGGASRETVQIAWGGGTPTYLEPEQIEALLGRIRSRFPIAADAEVGIEVDPRVTTEAHTKAIARAGFNRISMGIQDFDLDVQEEIHRHQSFETTRQVIEWFRENGLRSVNVDLVYGLPKQTLEKFKKTLDLIVSLDPDRVSAFSYAHVPWLKPAQRKFDEAEIARGAAKFAIFAHLLDGLTSRGMEFVGMDHFAKPDNELAVAQRTGGLWRNFQGFTTKSGTDLIGLGVTSIGSVAGTFAQNAKDLDDWQASVLKGELPTRKGLVLSADDHIRADVIHRIMCTYRLDYDEVARAHGIDFASYFAEALERLPALAADKLIDLSADGFTLTSWGRFFVRNVCMAFDAHLPKTGKPVYSRTV